MPSQPLTQSDAAPSAAQASQSLSVATDLTQIARACARYIDGGTSITSLAALGYQATQSRGGVP